MCTLKVVKCTDLFSYHNLKKTFRTKPHNMAPDINYEKNKCKVMA